jgi:hypothetical protein
MSRMFTAEGVGLGLAFKPRPDDVIITPFGKCGTTWLQQMVHSLRTGGDLEFDDISRVVPWIETAHGLGLDLDSPQRARPRAYKSHLSWDLVPKGGRYLLSVRDPRDALVSMYRFMEGWFLEPGAVSIVEYDRSLFMDRSRGGDYWTHLRSWWSHRHDDNVLLLAYEHMKADQAGTVRRIAEFLGIPLDAALLDVVCRESALESMIVNKDKYDDLLMRQRSEDVCNLPPGSDSSKVRKGEVGAYAYELPAEVCAELDQIWGEEITGPCGLADYAALLATLEREAAGR